MNFVQKLKNFRQNPKKAAVVLIIALFVAVFIWGRSAEAGEPEFGLGLGFGYASNEGATYQELFLRDASRNWYGSVNRIGGDTLNNYEYWRFCGGWQVNWRKNSNISPYSRLGACWFDEAPTDYISDNLAYELALGVRLWNIVEIDIDTHNSTAGRSEQNEGLDAVMIRMVFPF